MLNHQADIARWARDFARQLPDDQRIALGVSFIRTASGRENVSRLLDAAHEVGAHARLHMGVALRADADIPAAPFIDMTIDTTHGPDFDRHPGARGGVGASRSRIAFSWRATWARLRAAEAEFSESFWGDLIGAISVVLIGMALVIIAGVMQ